MAVALLSVRSWPGGGADAERSSQNLLHVLLPASRTDRDVLLAVALVRRSTCMGP